MGVPVYLVCVDDREHASDLCCVFDFIGEKAVSSDGSTDLHRSAAALITDRKGLVETSRIPVIWVGDWDAAPDGVSVLLDRKPKLDSLFAAIKWAQSVGSNGDDAGPEHLMPEPVGATPAIRQVRSLASKAARNDASVLITGEPGTGKAALARALHAASRRFDKPFVPIDCAGIAPELLESELFGHVKGAFQGALSDKRGLWELARGGTLFVAEIGAISVATQSKVMRALDEGYFERVGSADPVRSDVRLIVASHDDLEASIESKAFRNDLYYRISTFALHLPALRERIDDLPMLIASISEHFPENVLKLDAQAMDTLCRYRWPGNVRELSNLVERLLMQFPNRVIGSEDLPPKFWSGRSTKAVDTPTSTPSSSAEDRPLLPVNGIDLKDYLSRLEKSLIEQALGDCNDVVARAADKLRIRRTTLVEKMRKYGLSKDASVA